ncbi:carbohydrate ABC transporter permease [Shinella sp.]|uniref:carbohydrate ABC transporter permease n=1 Tax=Shinella sp. TaxID=1870904 RepID=UPI0029B81632|nr:carbohydrate ABC transporter permease [Shinella sp.]MDX3973519.1 carbohydrate ABC transporter permease [Shinella sp.]
MRPSKIIAYAWLGLCALFFAFPGVWMVVQSLKRPIDFNSSPPKVLFEPTLENYYSVLSNPGFLNAFRDSLVITGIGVGLGLLIGVPFAYVLARFDFKGKNDIAHFILSTRMLPAVVIIVPLAKTFQMFGLLDSYIGLGIAHVVLVLAVIVWVLRSFLQALPPDLEESGTMDGARPFRIMVELVLPIARPGIFTVAALAFLFSWNDLFFVLTLTSFNVQSLPVFLVTEYTGFLAVRWGEMSAAGVISIAPIAVIIVLLRKNIVRGLSMGAVK